MEGGENFFKIGKGEEEEEEKKSYMVFLFTVSLFRVRARVEGICVAKPVPSECPTN